MTQLYNSITALTEIAERLDSNNAKHLISAAKKTLDRTTFHLTILGEFKRGKSTLINSLLQEELMPVDILPTSAVVMVIEYDQSRSCTVSWSDGRVENWELSLENLKKLTYEGGIDTSYVKHVLLKLPADVLKSGLVLIDTPGVNDLNESRAEVTYGILPHSDAALFLLDAAAPLTRSEADFLTTKVLTNKLESIQFLVSKIDRLDQDEAKEALQGATERIQKVLGVPHEVLPYSIRIDSGSNSQNDTNPYRKGLLERIDLLKSNAEEIQHRRSAANIGLAAKHLIEDCQTRLALNDASEQKLTALREKLELQKDEHELRFQKLLSSIDFVGQETLEKMTRASIEKFFSNLERDLENDLRTQDQQVQKYWDQHLPKQVERALRLFSEGKSNEIRAYMQKFAIHLAKEYQRSFNDKLKLNLHESGINIEGFRAEIREESDSSMTTMIQNQGFAIAGAVVGSIVTLGIGTMIGASIGQIAGRYIGEKKNKDLKAQYLSELPGFMQTLKTDYSTRIEQSINEWFGELKRSVEDLHRDTSTKFVNQLESHSVSSESGLSSSELDQMMGSMKKILETTAIAGGRNNV